MLRIFTDPACLEHRGPPGFPERPERLEGVLEGLRRRGREVERPAVTSGIDEAVLAVHDEAYVERLRAAVERGDGILDSADNPLCAGTWAAARAAVGCVLAAVDWTVAGAGRSAFVAARPPGHHAERAMAMGFCYFNAVAVAAERLVRTHGVDRVAVVDFDVHHGNGTQHIFEERGDVLYASLHQYPFYPGTGAAAETGRGEGRGATVNVPLAAGSGDEDYRRAFEDRLLPALERFEPRVLLVSAGFDAWREDPLGGMRVSAGAFASWGRMLASAADELCSGRSVSLLEGGYDLARLPDLVERYLAGLEGSGSEPGASAAGDPERSVDASGGDG